MNNNKSRHNNSNGKRQSNFVEQQQEYDVKYKLRADLRKVLIATYGDLDKAQKELNSLETRVSFLTDTFYDVLVKKIPQHLIGNRYSQKYKIIIDKFLNMQLMHVLEISNSANSISNNL